MKKIPKQEYTAKFREQTVKHAQGVGIVMVAKELGSVEQTLLNWVKAAAAARTQSASPRCSAPAAQLAEKLLKVLF